MLPKKEKIDTFFFLIPYKIGKGFPKPIQIRNYNAQTIIKCSHFLIQILFCKSLFFLCNGRNGRVPKEELDCSKKEHQWSAQQNQ